MRKEIIALAAAFAAILFLCPYAAAQLSGSTDIDLSQMAGDESECAVAKNPANGNQLFVLCNVTAVAGLFAARSTSGGVSWTYPDPTDKTIADGDTGQGPAACCDPSLAWDSFGNLFLTYLGGADVVTLLSTDGGATFSLLATFSGSVDQPTTVVANTSAPGAPVAVWIVWNQSGSMVARGAPVTGLGAVGAFGPLQSIPGTAGCSFGDIAIAPSGAVVQACQTINPREGPGTIYVNTDADGLGPANFGAAVAATTTNVGGFDIIPAQSRRTIDSEAGLAFDSNPSSPHFGRLYLVYTEETVNENNDTDIMVRWSDNNGGSWSSPVRVNDDPASPIRGQFLPRIAVDSSTGNVEVCWHDCRSSSSNTAMRVYCSMATPGGATPTFSANAAIGDGASVSNLAGIEFGDYAGLAYFQGVSHPAWADTSNSTGNNPNGTANFDALTDRVTCTAPAPSLVSPANGSTVLSLSPVLDWSDVAGATSYEVQVATDPAFTSIVRSASTAASSWTVSPALSYGTTYFWRARAAAPCSGTFAAGWSFTTLEAGYVDCGFGCANLALGRTVTYSGLWDPVNNPASKLNDNNTGTTSLCQGAGGYCAIASDANHGQAVGNYFQIDLGAVKSVKSVTVFGRRDFAQTQGQNLNLKLSADGTNWTTWFMADTTSPDGLNVPTVKLARYVRVETTLVYYLSLYEVVVTGLCGGGGTEVCDGDDDNCDGLVDATCTLTTTTCPNQSATIDFTATTSSSFVCLILGLCTNARCDSWCRATDVLSGCNGDTGVCPGGTKAKYTSGSLLNSCLGSNPSVCRCSCQATGALYQAETPFPCTSCGNGFCDGTDTCQNCPDDCPTRTIELRAGECVLCDSTGETLCGPGMFPWCCY